MNFYDLGLVIRFEGIAICVSFCRQTCLLIGFQEIGLLAAVGPTNSQLIHPFSRNHVKIVSEKRDPIFLFKGLWWIETWGKP